MGKSLLLQAEYSDIAVEIGFWAWKALLDEVYTTPKPGLVDFYSCGAHHDMNMRTFQESAKAIQPYFVHMAEQGYTLNCSPSELFAQIRKTGIEAEKAMYRATNDVNTHKGLIFTIGIFCAAAGRCLREDNQMLTLDKLIELEKKMVSDVLAREIQCISTGNAFSHGEINIKNYGTSGIRGEAMNGYPSLVHFAIPTLLDGIRKNKVWNRAKLQTLFVLMSQVEDSNIISRHNPKILSQVQKEAQCFLNQGGAYQRDAIEKLYKMDLEYKKRNISAGGCADLLAAGIFLVLLLERW